MIYNFHIICRGFTRKLLSNFDEDNYVYAYCKCPLPSDYAIKWPRIKDGKEHRYSCICEDCGTEVAVVSKSHDPEVFPEREGKNGI